MMHKSIGYHTRLYSDHTVKVTGGCFGGSIDMDTVNRLTRLFTVNVKDTGHPVFVDKEGREVNLYLSVDVKSTEIGKAAITKWRAEKEQRDKEAAAIETAQRKALEEAVDSLGYEEALRRLSENG
jgi:hypothetical protein